LSQGENLDLNIVILHMIDLNTKLRPERTQVLITDRREGHKMVGRGNPRYLPPEFVGGEEPPEFVGGEERGRLWWQLWVILSSAIERE
jgi:hypothetical protein